MMHTRGMRNWTWLRSERAAAVGGRATEGCVCVWHGVRRRRGPLDLGVRITTEPLSAVITSVSTMLVVLSGENLVSIMRCAMCAVDAVSRMPLVGLLSRPRKGRESVTSDGGLVNAVNGGCNVMSGTDITRRGEWDPARCIGRAAAVWGSEHRARCLLLLGVSVSFIDLAHSSSPRPECSSRGTAGIPYITRTPCQTVCTNHSQSFLPSHLTVPGRARTCLLHLGHLVWLHLQPLPWGTSCMVHGHPRRHAQQCGVGCGSATAS